MSGDSGMRKASGYGERSQYEFSWRCRDCGHKWKRKIYTDNPLLVDDPPCPKCKKVRQQRAGLNDIIESGKAPAYTGTNVRVQAQDAAAEIIMQDHKLTDLAGPTDTRTGESSAPKLPANLQKMADGFFSPKKQLDSVGLGRQAGLIAQSAMSGGFSPAATGSPDPIRAAQAGRRTVKEIANVINEPKGS